ncbi:putative plastid-lipid-associated protein 11, chloroplastic [Glycine soja]
MATLLLPNPFSTKLPAQRYSHRRFTCSSITAQSRSAKEQLLALIADQDRGIKTQSDPAKHAAIVEAINAMAAAGEGSVTTGDALSATWRLLWTTEKEQLFIVEKAPLFGTQAGDVLQVIDVRNRTLNNVITFPPDGVFIVRSTIEVASPQRVNFRFPDWVNEKELWQIFHRWGTVWEVFIPKTKNKEGHRYGFVRFKEVEDELRLERQLDNNIFFGKSKMFVNRPKFERGKRASRNQKNQFTPVNGKPQGVTSYGRGAPRTNVTGARLRSYAEVVTMASPGQSILHNQRAACSQASQDVHRPPVVINTNMDQKAWLQKAWVGRLKNRGMFKKVEDELKWVLDPEVTPCYWADDWIILLNLDDSKATQIKQEEKTHGSTPILDLQKWSQDIRPTHRLAWILLWGLPPTAWESESMGKMVEAIGDMVEVDELVEQRRRLDVARILIRTTMTPGIRTELKAVIDGIETTLHVVEDTTWLGTRLDQKRMVSWMPPSPFSTEPNSPVVIGSDMYGADSMHETSEGSPVYDGDGFSTVGRVDRDLQTRRDQWVQAIGRCSLDRSFTDIDDVDYPHEDNAILNLYPTVEAAVPSQHISSGQKVVKWDAINASSQGNRRESIHKQAPKRQVDSFAGQQRNPLEETFACTDCPAEGKQEQQLPQVVSLPTSSAQADNRDSISLDKNDIIKEKGNLGLRPSGPILGSAGTKYYVRRKTVGGAREQAQYNQEMAVDPLTYPILPSPTKGTLKTAHTNIVSHLESECIKQDDEHGQINPHILEKQCLISRNGLHPWGIKWTAIRRIIMKQKVDLVCIQETKKDSFDKLICQSMWGDSSVSWDFVPSTQASGGLLCMWSNSDFQVERRVKGRHFLMLVGKWVKENQWLHIVNVYAPCDQAGKRILWDELSHLKASNPNGLWCVLGDFNSIRSQDERITSSQRIVTTSDISDFNNWISEMELHDVRCLGSNFTWFRPNGSAKSRLDRFLVCDQWLSLWPNTSQHVLQRDFSDHCPLILKTKMVDWGLKPFRVVDWWLNQKGYHSMIKEAWTADQQGGWGGIALKNKLRNLRYSIKQWSKEKGDIKANKIQQLKQKLANLENIASHRTLSESEVQTKRALQQELWDTANAYESLMRQKSRAKWIKEGDLFVGEASWDNIIVLKSMLRGFEMVSGLRINYAKSQFGIVGFQPNWAHDAAQLLNCRQLDIPFHYLGMPIANGRDKGWHSQWWKDLRKLYHQPEFQIIHQNMTWKVGCGDKVRFWQDSWLGQEGSLQQKYNQLFVISRQQNLPISKMGKFYQNTWNWDFKWRRNLFDHENEQAIAFMDDISAISIHQQLQDSMLWKADPTGIYSTKSAYRLLLPNNSVMGLGHRGITIGAVSGGLL